MRDNKNGAGAALLFFPERKHNTFFMQLSEPPPDWLSGRDLSKITIEKQGIYCLFFLVISKPGGRAFISINGKEIRGSCAEEHAGFISGSAVCSIHDPGLPCNFAIKTEAGAGEGALFVFRYDI